MQVATRVQNTTYKVLGLSSGVSYYFAVRAENSHGMSGPSQLSEPITMGVVSMKKLFLHLISFCCSRSSSNSNRSSSSSDLLLLSSRTA